MACIECGTDNAHAEIDAGVGHVSDVCDVDRTITAYVDRTITAYVDRTITAYVEDAVVDSCVPSVVSASRVGAVLTTPTCRHQCQ